MELFKFRKKWLGLQHSLKDCLVIILFHTYICSLRKYSLSGEWPGVAKQIKFANNTFKKNCISYIFYEYTLVYDRNIRTEGGGG